jgi:hypothetical protein
MKCSPVIPWQLPDRSMLFEFSEEPLSSVMAATMLGEQRRDVERQGAEFLLANPGKTFLSLVNCEPPLLVFIYHAGHSRNVENGWQIYWTERPGTAAARWLRDILPTLATIPTS